MSIFADIQGSAATDPGRGYDELRDQINGVSIVALINHLGLRWNRKHDCIVCPAHKNGQEKDPSAHVYPDHVFCFTCGTYFSQIDLVMVRYDMSYAQACIWFEENIASLGGEPVEVLPAPSIYKGPAPIELVTYWQNLLSDAKRDYLRGRLLSDRTITDLGLGWRPDYEAYTIPFWRGKPKQSQVDIVQFRHTRGEKRYTGMRGHNRPSLINSHLIGKHSVVLLFGTFDAILAAQDGIAAVSSNGASAFMRDPDDRARLKEAFGSCKVYLVPDRSMTEAGAAYAIASYLNAEVRHFPDDMQGKDYTDYRLEGHTPTHFFKEVLMMNLGVVDPEHDYMFTGLFESMSNGDWDHAETFLLVLEQFYQPAVTNQYIQTRLKFDPYPGLTHDQWEILRVELPSMMTGPSLHAWAKAGCDWAHQNKGGF